MTVRKEASLDKVYARIKRSVIPAIRVIEQGLKEGSEIDYKTQLSAAEKLLNKYFAYVAKSEESNRIQFLEDKLKKAGISTDKTVQEELQDGGSGMALANSNSPITDTKVTPFLVSKKAVDNK